MRFNTIIDANTDVFHIRDIVISTVNNLKRDYYSEFGPPTYVKLPARIYDIMGYAGSIYTEVLEADCPKMLLGLRVCPTKSIESIEEIEVF